jgi:hypothetical protein
MHHLFNSSHHHHIGTQTIKAAFLSYIVETNQGTEQGETMDHQLPGHIICPDHVVLSLRGMQHREKQ